MYILRDGKTIYEPTSISLAELPKNIRKKNQKGCTSWTTGTLQLPRKLQQLKIPGCLADVLCTVTNTADSAPTSRLPAPDIRTHHSS